MIEHLHAILHKLQFVVAAVLILSIVFMVSLIMSTLQSHSSRSSVVGSSFSLSNGGGANAITAGFADIATQFTKVTKVTTQGCGHALSISGSYLAAGARSTGYGILSFFAVIGRGVSASLLYIMRIPGNAVGAVTHASANALIRPADHNPIPVIDPNSPELQKALAAVGPVDASGNLVSQTDQGPVWPIHGAITTYFGVPHRPYQITHTGLDISDGARRGTTPVHPFKPGRVMDVVHSNVSLGNHVVIDHGNGITSVYGHMDSTSVVVGQEVTLGTVLGLEGTTGVSTGVHLHFEIRVNNQAADPLQFISGRP